MAYDRDRHSDIGGAAAAILVALILGLLVLAVVGFFFLMYSRSQSQMVMAKNQAMVAQEKAERFRIEAELRREQLLAESDPVTDQQITISVDENGNTSVDGKSMQLDELENVLRELIDESSGHLSVVVRVDDQCRFERVAKILSACDEAGIERPRLVSSRD